MKPYTSCFTKVSFIGGGNRSFLKKTPTCRKSLTNFIMVKAPSIKMQLYLFEGLLFKKSIFLLGPIRGSEAIAKLLNFLA
jgi:hypothetical protein